MVLCRRDLVWRPLGLGGYTFIDTNGAALQIEILPRESSLLSAYSALANNLGTINANYTASKTELDNEHQDALGDLERSKNEELSDLKLAYGENKTKNATAAGEASMEITEKYRTEDKERREKEETEAKERETKQKENYDEIMDNEVEYWDTELIERMAADGDLSASQLAQCKTHYNSSVLTGREAFEGVDIHGAWAYFVGVMDHPWVSDENKRALANTFKAMYPDVASDKVSRGEYAEWLNPEQNTAKTSTASNRRDSSTIRESKSETNVTYDQVKQYNALSEDGYNRAKAAGYVGDFSSYQDYINWVYKSNNR